ncbi:MAG: hypothetical protein FJX76_06365 [Armatimonadetes bacterium]|nr:hypothetical protein [Armatimonadota bacterium]
MARKASPIWLYRALGAGLGILTVSVVSGGFEGGAFRQTMGIAAIVAALSITGYYSLRALANAWVAALVATLAPLPILAPYLRYYLSLDGGARYPEVLAAVMITSALIACLWRCVDQRPLSVTE